MITNKEKITVLPVVFLSDPEPQVQRWGLQPILWLVDVVGRQQARLCLLSIDIPSEQIAATF